MSERFEMPALSEPTYEELRRGFSWHVPRRFNLGTACTDAHPADRPALIHVRRSGEADRYTFGDLSRLSNRMANALTGLGMRPGDRVAVALSQSPEAAVAHLGALKARMISVPLSHLFGVDALRHRLADSGAELVVTDSRGLEKLEELTDIPRRRWIVLTDGDAAGDARIRGFWPVLKAASDRLPTPPSGPSDPCILIYTSGTSGPPKGVLHGHQVLIGQAPGFRLCHEFIPQQGDRMWTPADWAWIGGLCNTVMLAWMHGVPVVSAARGKFDPEWALHLMARHEIRNAFLPTTALRMMLQCEIPGDLRLRSMLAGGEAQEPWLFDAARAAFRISFNEAYGQTEADFVVGHCASRWPARAGSMGRAYPGHEVRVMRRDGELAAPGEVGEVVVRMPDPTALLRYWNRPDATQEKVSQGWLHTGDLARMDEEGYFWFESRVDDVIKSAGYRIGPGEIEECLLGQEAVANAAVIGVPDEVRGHVIKAYVQLKPGFSPSGELEGSLRDHVRTHLAAYQYPKFIEFIESLPLTATGKIARSVLREQAARTSRPEEEAWRSSTSSPKST
jgi:acetyl-CoA synthetase